MYGRYDVRDVFPSIPSVHSILAFRVPMPLSVQESFPLKAKTTMKIGGVARYGALATTQAEVVEAVSFAHEKRLPLVVLGGGSNTIFADGEINAVVLQVKHDVITIDDDVVRVGAGAYLATLLLKCAEQGLDLSALTGIPGSVGGAIFGNAGQGPQGVWIDTFIESVTVFFNGAWHTFSKEECHFRYRESVFKDRVIGGGDVPILFEATLRIPRTDPSIIQSTIEGLLQKRIDTQPHLKTAGSCFKAVSGTPAWQLIDQAQLRGKRTGGIEISSKHANFLINVDHGTFDDALALMRSVQEAIPHALEVEMRCIGTDGREVRL